MNLFITRLNPETTADDLLKLFTHYGAVSTTRIIFDRLTGRSKSYGFDEMPNSNEALEAMNELNNSSFQESMIIVKLAQSDIDDEGRNGIGNAPQQALNVQTNHRVLKRTPQPVTPHKILKTNKEGRNSDHR